MNKETIKKADIVQLKSSSPSMTVKEVSDGKANCIWFNYHSYAFQEQEIPLDLLEVINVKP